MRLIFSPAPLVLSLVLLVGCGQGAAPAQTPAPGATPLAATVQQATLVVDVEAVNGLSIVEVEGGSLAFTSGGDDCRYTAGAPIKGITTVTIRQKDTSKSCAAVLAVPRGAYAVIRVEGENSAVTLTPRTTAYQLRGTNCAVSVTLPADYGNRLSADLDDSALTLTLMGPPKNLTLSLITQDCSVAAPEAWGYRSGKPLALTRGTGGASLDLTLEDCAVTLRESSSNFLSRYQGQSSGVTSMMIRPNSAELLLTNESDGFFISGRDDDAIGAARAAAKPGGVTAIRTVPATGVKTLQVNADLCGVVLEPTSGTDFQLSYVGVENPAEITVTAAVENGVLTVTSQGRQTSRCYISAAADFQVNCVRIGVPANVLTALAVDCGRAVIATHNLTLPAVTGGASKGIVLLQGAALTSPVALSTTSGSLVLNIDDISAPVELSVINGDAEITAKRITAAATLTASNGHVGLEAESATGLLTLTATNGSVEATVGQVGSALLQAKNGVVDATLGTITGNTKCAVTNGALSVNLTKNPVDLTFYVTGSWEGSHAHDDWYNGKDEGPTGLPAGWHDGLVLGSGKPTLTLSAASNGVLTFTAPK